MPEKKDFWKMLFMVLYGDLCKPREWIRAVAGVLEDVIYGDVW